MWLIWEVNGSSPMDERAKWGWGIKYQVSRVSTRSDKCGALRSNYTRYVSGEIEEEVQ